MARNFHSVPKGNDWAVKKEGQKKPVSTHRTQAAAEEKTRQLAKKAEVEAVYHKGDGTIKDKDSYGNDPRSIKDRVH